MRLLPVWLGVVVYLLGAGMALAQGGPDTAYVRIYHMIQEADALRERGRTKEAVDRYQQARQELLKFKEIYATWHPNIIQYRMNYIGLRLEPLVPSGPSTNAVAAKPNLESMTPEQQVAALKKEIQELTEQNQRFQEKLKEAWAAQPAAADPQEYAKAQERIKELEKERDLLKVSLEQAPPPAPAPVPADTAALDQERRVLAEVRKQLESEQARSAGLQQENESLKTMLAGLQSTKPVSPLPDSDVSRQYAAATTQLAELRSTNLALVTQIVFLETQMAELKKSAQQSSSPTRLAALEDELKSAKAEVKSLRRERDTFEKKFNAANRRLERRKSGTEARELEDQLQVAQARLLALEAPAVPLTPEEAALVNTGANIKIDLATPATNSTPRKAMELPPGAGPLFNQALAAIERGRLAEAEQKLRDILRQDAKNVVVLSHLSGVLLELKQNDESEKYLRQVLDVEPNEPAGLYLLGVLRYQQERYDDAFEALSRAAQINPNKPETQFYLGLVLLQKGNRGPAETALRKAIQLRPGWSMAHYELAVVYATQKPPFMELAQWHYQKAVTAGTPRNFDLEKLLESKIPVAP